MAACPGTSRNPGCPVTALRKSPSSRGLRRSLAPANCASDRAPGRAIGGLSGPFPWDQPKSWLPGHGPTQKSFLKRTTPKPGAGKLRVRPGAGRERLEASAAHFPGTGRNPGCPVTALRKSPSSNRLRRLVNRRPVAALVRLPTNLMHSPVHHTYEGWSALTGDSSNYVRSYKRIPEGVSRQTS